MSEKKKTTLRKSSVLKKSEYHSIVGLLTLAAQHQRDMKAIEQALLDITLECDYDGKLYEVWKGGHVGDAVNSGDVDPSDLLRKLGLRAQR